MKALQSSLVLVFVFLSCTDLTEGQMGHWSKCFGFPPTDSFKAPDGLIVAWSPEDQRPGRADAHTQSDPGCVAYFAKGTEIKQEEDGSFFVLRQVTLIKVFYHLRFYSNRHVYFNGWDHKYPRTETHFQKENINITSNYARNERFFRPNFRFSTNPPF